MECPKWITLIQPVIRLLAAFLVWLVLSYALLLLVQSLFACCLLDCCWDSIAYTIGSLWVTAATLLIGNTLMRSIQSCDAAAIIRQLRDLHQLHATLSFSNWTNTIYIQLSLCSFIRVIFCDVCFPSHMVFLVYVVESKHSSHDKPQNSSFHWLVESHKDSDIYRYINIHVCIHALVSI